MQDHDVDPARCPLCGEPNECGAVQGLAKCWCYDVRIPPAVLDRLPDAAKGVACVCARCAAAALATPTD